MSPVENVSLIVHNIRVIGRENGPEVATSADLPIRLPDEARYNRPSVVIV